LGVNTQLSEAKASCVPNLFWADVNIGAKKNFLKQNGKSVTLFEVYTNSFFYLLFCGKENALMQLLFDFDSESSLNKLLTRR